MTTESLIAVPQRHARRHRRAGRAGRVRLPRRRQQQGWTTEADLLDGRRTGPDDIEAMPRAPQQPHPARRARTARTARLRARGDRGRRRLLRHVLGAPDLQGGGIGKPLLAEAERIVREEWRLPAMRMTVIDVRDELIAFYERRGYRRTGIKKPFPYGDERFGLPKRDDLRFEVLEKPL